MNEMEMAKSQIIKTGKRLYETGLAVAKSGNLSFKIDPKTILITATSTALGQLNPEDIVLVELDSLKCNDKNKPSSELPLHSLIYKNSSASVVLHAHPPLINGYFAVNDKLEAITFETKFYLGNVPVIKQDTPTVTELAPVIEALKSSNIVVLKNHGVVSIADNFSDALALVEALEEAIKSAVVAKLFSKGSLSVAEEVIKERLSSEKAYPMFSKEHIQAIVDLVNKDDFISQKGKELDLTVNLAIKLNETNQVYKFNFDKGKIIRLDCDADAPFVISAPREVWQQVFSGNLDSFVAVTQGKMKLEGQLGQLSKWYVPFSRLFELFKQVRFK